MSAVNGPWVHMLHGPLSADSTGPRTAIRDADGMKIADADYRYAAFIVLACNTHDQLLSLAERYASECGECGGGGVIEPVQPNGSRPCPACADTRQVIATAKGGRT